MITYLKSEIYDEEKTLVEIACNSSDTKPTSGIATGSMALEVNTGKMYAFDEKTSSWCELS